MGLVAMSDVARPTGSLLSSQLTAYVPPTPRLSPELIRLAALGALGLVAVSILTVVVPGPDALREAHTWLLGTEFSATVIGVLKLLNEYLFGLGVACLLLDGVLWLQPKHGDGWRLVCLAQPWTAVGVLGLTILAFLLPAISIVLWTALGAFVLVVLGAMAEN